MKQAINIVGMNRKFGISMGAILACIGLYRYIYPQSGYLVFGVLSCLFIAAAVIAPLHLNLIRLIWGKAGHYLGIINTTIILTVVYIVIFIPLSFVIRLMGHDLLGKNFNTKQNTYWQTREGKVSSLKNQF